MRVRNRSLQSKKTMVIPNDGGGGGDIDDAHRV